MRLSDIIKKSDKQPLEPPEKPELKQVQPLIPQKTDAIIQKPAHLTENTHPSISAEHSYAQAIVEIKNIVTFMKNASTYDGDFPFIGEFMMLLIAKNNEILLLTDRATPDIYLYGHSVNVCILSLMVGIGLKYDEAKLLRLGHCAYLHDIGMSKVLDTILKTSKLTPADTARVKKHVQFGAELAGSFSHLSDVIKSDLSTVISQTHERQNGSGYPLGIKAEDIHDFAKIIALVDVYEALTHPRLYRPRMIPHEAVKSLIAMAADEFDPDMVKVFVENISLYPPGTYVRLNSEEIARVIGINAGLPTRPTIRVIIDTTGNKLPAAKTIDLASTPMLFIKEPIDETKLNLTDKKLSIELKAMRWWVKGL